MVKRGKIEGVDEKPEVNKYGVLISAYNELGTERVASCIPVSKISEYLNINRLPDYWCPAIIQLDRNQREAESENGNE